MEAARNPPSAEQLLDAILLVPPPHGRQAHPGAAAPHARARLAGGIEGDFYKHMVAGMRNGVLAITREGTLSLINDIACEVLGLRDGQRQLGRPIAEAFEHHPEILFVLADVFERDHLQNRAEMRLKPSGKVIGYTLSHITDDRGQLVGASMFFKDLTRVEQLNERERLRDRLVAIGELAAVFAHEVKNPLAGIEHADVVVGTRASAFAPVHDLGLAVVWDDGDPLHAEPRAPYPHVREVLALRSELEGCALLVAAHGRSVEAQALVESGWAREVAADGATTRARAPRVQALTSVELAREGPAAAARLPAPAWRTVRDRLADGPVLVQVPRAGYLPAVACGRCRAAARCGELSRPARADVGDRRAHVRVVRLAGHRLAVHRVRFGRAAVGSGGVGTHRRGARSRVPRRARACRPARARRPGCWRPSRTSPAVVVSTPGAEPVAPGGYAAALLLDASVSTAGRGAAHRVRTHCAVVDGGCARPAGRATGESSCWSATPRSGRRRRSSGGTRPGTRPESWPSGPSSRCPRRSASRRSRVRATPWTRSWHGSTCRELEVLGPVPVDAREESLEPEVRALVRVPRSKGAALARSLSGVAGGPQRAP